MNWRWRYSRLLSWSAVGIWMVVIFLFSNQAHSGEITEQYLGDFNVSVRKCAHMFEYFVLFLLLKWSFSTTKRSGNSWPLLFTVIYAATDEWHQSFVPGRSSNVTDVLVDSCGALIAWVLLYTRVLIRQWKKTPG